MTKFKRAVVATILLYGTGCAEIIQGDLIAMETVSKMVDTYCRLPESARAVNRARWNWALQPNKIQITCSK